MPLKDLNARRAYTRAYRAANRAAINANHRAYCAANREEVNARHRAWRSANPEKAKEHARKWREKNAALANYNFQKRAARQRRIAFLLTFEQWMAIWIGSNKWEQRGRRRGQYVMARFGDIGPYAVGNVKICTNRENLSEAQKARWARHRGLP